MTDKIEILHRYNLLVRRELVPPLLCSADGFELTVRIYGNPDEPVLKCYICGSVTTPGTQMYQDLESKLK